MPSIDEVFDSVIEFYQQRFPGKGTGFYSKHDWARLRKALYFVSGDDVLDVGVSNGAFLRALSLCDEFERVSGIDIRKHSMFIAPDNAEYFNMSVTDMRFEDNSFDTVVCMEVLEHLEVADLPTALKELRRVCRNRLICTVPFKEPEPVWRFDRKGGHRQSFDEDKLGNLFPAAQASLIPRASSPWVMMIEDDRSDVDEFVIIEFSELRQKLGVTAVRK